MTLPSTSIRPAQTLQADLAAMAEWGHRGLKMARHLLDFSGQSVSRFRLYDLQWVLTQLLPHLQRTLLDAIRIVLESRPGAYLVKRDVARMLQLLLHLTLNARDAMPEGGELYWRLSHLTLPPDAPPPHLSMQPGRWVKLTVSDTCRRRCKSACLTPFLPHNPGGKRGWG